MYDVCTSETVKPGFDGFKFLKRTLIRGNFQHLIFNRDINLKKKFIYL